MLEAYSIFTKRTYRVDLAKESKNSDNYNIIQRETVREKWFTVEIKHCCHSNHKDNLLEMAKNKLACVLDILDWSSFGHCTKNTLGDALTFNI